LLIIAAFSPKEGDPTESQGLLEEQEEAANEGETEESEADEEDQGGAQNSKGKSSAPPEDEFAERGRSFTGGKLRNSFVDFLHQTESPTTSSPSTPPLHVPERQGTIKRSSVRLVQSAAPDGDELAPVPDKMWDAYVQYMEELIINNENGSNDPFLCRELFDIKLEDGTLRSVAVLYNTEAGDVVGTVVKQLAAERGVELQPGLFCLVERNEENQLERLVSAEEYLLALVLSWEVPEKMCFVLKAITPKIEERRRSMPVRVRQTRHIQQREDLLKKKKEQQQSDDGE